MTEYKRVLIQSGERRRRTGHKINSQIECAIIRKIQTSLEMFKTFYSSSDWRMICFYSDIACFESKVIFKWRENNNDNKNKKKPLQGANVRTSWISFSQNSRITRQTNAGDKGCAEACTERFSALKDQHWRHVVSSLSAAISETFSWSFRKCSDFDLLSFYEGLGRKIFTQITLGMVLFSVWWR